MWLGKRARHDPIESTGPLNLNILFAQACLSEYLTHLSLAFHKKDTSKQCRARSDAAECGV